MRVATGSFGAYSAGRALTLAGGLAISFLGGGEATLAFSTGSFGGACLADGSSRDLIRQAEMSGVGMHVAADDELPQDCARAQIARKPRTPSIVPQNKLHAHQRVLRSWHCLLPRAVRIKHRRMTANSTCKSSCFI